jgi:pimeloyl-ACP methyl ester carboxylesterase
MSAFAPFRSAASKAAFMAWYDRQVSALPAPLEQRQVDTASGGRTQRMVRAMFAPGATPLPFALEFGMLTVEHWQAEVRPMPVFSATQIRGLTSPLLVLAGERDPFFPPDAVLAWARRVIPGVVAEPIAGCGHLLDADHIGGVRARTLAFLRADAAPVINASDARGR